MLIRNLNTNEVYEALTMEPISGGGGGGGDVTMAQVRAEIAKNVGKGVQLGFDGTLSSGTITFTPPTGSDVYEIKENYDYEIDLSFQATSTAEMDDETAMIVVNDDTTYTFWTVKDTPATWGDLKDIYTYSADTGYRWLFKARYHITSSGNKVFYIFPAVDNSLTSVQLYSDGTSIYDKEGGTVLNYSQVYSLISSKYNLVNVNYDNVITLYPVFWDGSAISFSNTYIYDNKCWQQRIIINSDNQVLFNEYQAVTPNDYATTTTGGVVKSGTYGLTVNSTTGLVTSAIRTYDQYTSDSNNYFIGKGTLENVLTGRNYQTLTDVQTLISQIPKFKVLVVTELPETGDSMTLYLVPKTGTTGDVYNEYVWVSSTSTFELLGSTAVDLSDYVKKDSYETFSFELEDGTTVTKKIIVVE